MNDWTSWLLWADREKFRYLGEGFRGEHAQLEAWDMLLGLICVLGGLLALWGLSKFVARRERAARVYSPDGLFRQLCKAHALDRASSRALMRLAVQEQLEHPARLFLEPERFDRSSPLVDGQRPLYQQLQRRIFGSSATEDHIGMLPAQSS